jgi:tripartite-type tricarboxylate transporter receptor subunit TctC
MAACSLRHLTVNATLAVSVALALSPAAQADTFPSKAVTLIVPYAAGGPTDATARRLAELMGKALGGTVLVENKTGAATIVAAEYVARAPKDGYTLLISPGTTTSANPHLYRKLPYKVEDFAPITLLSRQPWVLTAGPVSGARDYAAFDKYAKAKKDVVSFGTTGVGSLSHIVGDWIGRTVGWKMGNVPYKGSAASVSDLLGGRLDSQVEAIASGLQLDQGGKAKVIAVLADKRSPVLPQVPTFRELGHPELVAYVTFGLMAPAGTPAPVLDKLHAATVQALRDPAFVKQMAQVGEEPVPSATRQEYAKLVRDEHARWGKIIAPLGVQLD